MVDSANMQEVIHFRCRPELRRLLAEAAEIERARTVVGIAPTESELARSLLDRALRSYLRRHDRQKEAGRALEVERRLCRAGMTRHPKTIELARLLGVERAAAVGLLACLWSAITERDPAHVRTLRAEDVEGAAGWRGRRGALASAMAAAGFLDKIGGRYRCHNWAEHSGGAGP